jgi:hypothetical protein
MPDTTTAAREAVRTAYGHHRDVSLALAAAMALLHAGPAPRAGDVTEWLEQIHGNLADALSAAGSLGEAVIAAGAAVTDLEPSPAGGGDQSWVAAAAPSPAAAATIP